ncbi:MAG: radical SAM protein [Desulfurococcaceae archaeon]|nr:radical SAM protein [Sulfolobales archaeon]MDW8170187.1 radical SAM protein [Desulfurococcaceae archaeon]
MPIRRVVILDGYTDEPAGLGVPPFINVYPRLVAGGIWLADSSIEVRYFTVNLVRQNLGSFINEALLSDLVVLIAGAEVPGKYIGGRPISLSEVVRISTFLADKDTALVGPAARYGFSSGGGSSALDLAKLKNLFKYLVSGDPEIFFYQLIKVGPERAEPWRLREDYELADKAFTLGANIVIQHPNYEWNLIVELETYRSCPRYIVGGCSFCIDVRYGPVMYRRPESIVREVEVLSKLGVKHYRVGKQADILTYMSHDTGILEFPKPKVEAIERLFHGVRTAASNLRVLHIDNVNPGTVFHYREESVKALKTIVKYHTPGDVAALGVESFDPRVVRANNLKVYPDEAVEAIRIINSIGSRRGWNGLPELLPGINIVLGLPGETKETYRINYEYLKKVLDEGLLIRRINVRKVAVLLNTPLWSMRNSVMHVLRKHSYLYKYFRLKVMRDIDKPMITRIVPQGTIVDYLYTERHSDSYTIARQPGSYPIAFFIKGNLELRKVIRARVTGHKSKSAVGEVI